MRILFIAQARMGDVCCAIPAYTVLRRTHPKAHIAWQVAGKYSVLLPEDVDEVIRTKMPAGTQNVVRKHDFDTIIKAQPMFRHKEWEKSGKHIIDLIADWSGVRLESNDRKIRIAIPDDVADKISSFGFVKKPFVTVCCSPCYSCYNWDYRSRQKLVSELKRRGYRVAAIGGKDGREIGADKHFHGELNVIETVAMISKSIGYIGPDNGVSWLASSVKHIPKIMLIDKRRLKQGVTGFQRYLHNKKIRDLFYEDAKPRRIIKIMEKLR